MADTPTEERIMAGTPVAQGIAPSPTADDIVRLVTAPNPAQAHIWQQALKEEGISNRVVGDYLDVGLGDIPGMRAEIWIHRNDLARAQEVLERIQAGAAEDKEEEGEEE